MTEAGWTLLLTVLACGLGTFVLRALPFWWRLRRRGASGSQSIRRWSSAMGPAALAALLVASLHPLVWPAAGPARILPVAAAVAAVVVWQRLCGGLVGPTLWGTAVYAWMVWVDGGP
ncbi:AzlD domain-containing protein [Caldimonas manganoxidans]|uniref:AzlD domain-containing protein n=1 Tax=Caldimonas manganoxidans TaxID=196015 RepID=UPI0003828E49|nr:AzlD domain-containing protein [Caldimonas manganoxidans]